MKKLLLFFAVFLSTAVIAMAQSDKKAKSPKKTVRTTTAAKTTAPASATQARPQAAIKAPEAASSLFEATKSDRKKQK